MRRFLLPLLLLLSSGLASAEQISVLGLRPTQMQIGKRAADFHVENWRKDAKQRGLTLKQYAATVLKPRFAGTELPVVIDPKGHYRNTDGHHRMTALRKVSKLTGVRFDVKAKLLRDYRGKTFEEYAEDFTSNLKKGQFTPEVEKLDAVARMRQLPETYDKLGDNTLRTALEVVFTRNQISGSLMRDYVEFRVAEELLKRGILDELKDDRVLPRGARTLPSNLATDERVLKVVRKMLGKKHMKDFLLDEANNKADKKTLEDRLESL